MYPQALTFLLIIALESCGSIRNNYNPKYIPAWKQRACEKPKQSKKNSHYVCDENGDFKCLPGWQGDLCQVPICRKGCDPMNGYCQRPGECRCKIGYQGELCEKCIPLPGCQQGDCSTPFQCTCKPGWGGIFCSEPTCKTGCHPTRGYCDTPDECRCRLGWAGAMCQDCQVLPGCQNGTCKKPLECICLPGYVGLLCQTAICSETCHKQHGYCRKPGECRCKVGWMGQNCNQCHPYPGCVNGDCERPWECICKPGWGGLLCNEALTYCAEHPTICKNGGKCISLTKDDGLFRCICANGYRGVNCEIETDEHLLLSMINDTSTTEIPKITPPPSIPLSMEENASVSLGNGIKVETSNSVSENMTASSTEASLNITAQRSNQTDLTISVNNATLITDDSADNNDEEEYEYEDDDEEDNSDEDDINNEA